MCAHKNAHKHTVRSTHGEERASEHLTASLDERNRRRGRVFRNESAVFFATFFPLSFCLFLFCFLQSLYFQSLALSLSALDLAWNRLKKEAVSETRKREIEREWKSDEARKQITFAVSLCYKTTTTTTIPHQHPLLTPHLKLIYKSTAKGVYE